MQQSFVTYLALGAAVLVALAGFAALRRGNSTFRSRSAVLFALSGSIAVAGFSAALVLDDTDIFVGATTGALLAAALGIVTYSSETDMLGKIAEEQRVDFISGLPNERLFFERLAAEHSRTKRTNQRYSIAVFEIDSYGLLSDEDKTNGLKLLADSLRDSIRNTDTLGRIEGHQVAVLLVDTLADGAIVGCDRACERFFFQSCGHSESAHVTRPLTVSVGIAAFDDDTVDPAHVVDNAQLALKRLRDEMDSGIKVYEPGEFIRATDTPLEALDNA